MYVALWISVSLYSAGKSKIYSKRSRWWLTNNGRREWSLTDCEMSHKTNKAIKILVHSHHTQCLPLRAMIQYTIISSHHASNLFFTFSHSSLLSRCHKKDYITLRNWKRFVLLYTMILSQHCKQNLLLFRLVVIQLYF